MNTLVIAQFTFREALRRRMIWGVLLLSLVFAGLYYWGYTAVRADFSPEGWAEPATLSAAPLMESPACSRPDFWESGFRLEAALSVVDWRLRSC